MKARAQRAEDVSAVELSGGEQVEGSGEEADPRGAANWVKKDVRDGRMRIEKRRESMNDERRAQDGADVFWIGEAGHDFGVKDAEDECGQRDDESEERAGGADVKECALGSNRRADEDECAECAYEAGERHEIGIAGVDVMVAAGEIVAEFVNQENGQECEREGKARDESEWMFVEQRERVEEFIEVDGFVFGVGGGEVRAGYEAGAESEKEKKDREQKCFERGMRRYGGVVKLRRDVWLDGAPVAVRRIDRDVWVCDGVVHEW